jgi:hypothetical protein
VRTGVLAVRDAEGGAAIGSEDGGVGGQGCGGKRRGTGRQIDDRLEGERIVSDREGTAA